MLKEKGFYKGVNLGGWLSQCDYSEERLNRFINEKDIETIASWGADHVRIPFDYNILENSDGSYNEDGFERLRRAVEVCQKNGLNTVLDLHKTAGFSFDSYGESESGFFDSPEYQERFCRLWEQIAMHFGSESDHVAFELLNEVTDECYIKVWNRIVNEVIPRIRKYAPDTLILVGSYENNSAETVQYLDPPYDDKVIYNFHCYDPLRFTHQGAYWTDRIDPQERVSYADSGCSPRFFEDFFASALAQAKKYNAQLYCGEFGIIDKVSPEDTIAWYRDINSVFEKYGIGRCAWSYKEMDFGLTDHHLDSIRSDLIKYL